MVTKAANDQSQDFSVYSVDLPALPGSSSKDPPSSNGDSKSDLNIYGKTTLSTDGLKFPGQKMFNNKKHNWQKKRIQALSDEQSLRRLSG